MRVLVVGGGGREHALMWALHRDSPDAGLFAAPGNPGTALLGSPSPHRQCLTRSARRTSTLSKYFPYIRPVVRPTSSVSR